MAEITRASIETRAMAASNVHAQIQSPLFGGLPGELRNQIFELALEQYDDPDHMYRGETYYCRPGSLGEKRVDTQLLRTCKRVYQEAKALPLRGAELYFYGGSKDRAPPGTYLTYATLVTHTSLITYRIRVVILIYLPSQVA